MATTPGEHGTLTIEHPGNDVALIRLVGEHDLTTANELQAALDGQIAAGRGLVVSVSETQFIDSTVLRCLFYASASLRARNRTLALHVNTASIVKRTLELVDFETVAHCTGSLEEAVAVASEQGAG